MFSCGFSNWLVAGRPYCDQKCDFSVRDPEAEQLEILINLTLARPYTECLDRQSGGGGFVCPPGQTFSQYFGLFGKVYTTNSLNIYKRNYLVLCCADRRRPHLNLVINTHSEELKFIYRNNKIMFYSAR